jgi:CubicO group peptidase (beta-lactamase class C family)
MASLKKTDDVERILLQEVERHQTPSVQYIIFDETKVIYKFQKGFADIAKKKEVNDATTYHAFSVTKTFTALAVLQLAEHGTLDLDDPVTQYLHEFPYSRSITIKQLLNHTAGIPNPIPLNWIHLAAEHETFDRNAFNSEIFARHNKTKSKPGERFVYSNLGYILLGQLIAAVSGISYENYIRENVFKRLHLRPEDIGFTTVDPDQSAKGYHKRISFSSILLGMFIDKPKYMGHAEEKWRPFNNFYVNGTAYGGLIGTPSSFMKYIQDLLKHDSALIGKDCKKMLFTENLTNNGKQTGMCLSWFKGKLFKEEYFAHAGGGGGYYCEIRIYPRAGLGSVVMFNRTGMSDERFLDKIDQYFFDHRP